LQILIKIAEARSVNNVGERSGLQIDVKIIKKLALRVLDVQLEENLTYGIYFSSRDFMITLQLKNEDLMTCCFAIEKAFYHYKEKILITRKRKACKIEEFAANMIDASG
jgi:hypothetical protein